MLQHSKISQEDLTKFLQSYNLGVFREVVEDERDDSSLSHIFYTSQGRYSLIFGDGLGQTESASFHLEFLDHLSRRGFPCRAPIKRVDGGLYGGIADKCAALASYSDGLPSEEVTSEYCACMGEVLALLHTVGADFPGCRRSPFHPVAWGRVVEGLRRAASPPPPDVSDMIEEEVLFLRQRWPEGMPGGVIHGNLTPRNVLLDEEGALTVIGFASACNDMWALDLAICLNAWGFEPDGAYNVGKSHALTSAYRAARRGMEKEEIEAFPVLVRGAALDAVLKILSSRTLALSASAVPPHSPSDLSRCMDILRFHQMVDGAESYGLA